MPASVGGAPGVKKGFVREGGPREFTIRDERRKWGLEPSKRKPVQFSLVGKKAWVSHQNGRYVGR